MFKILIVEDDRDLNRSVCTYLNNNGYEAVGCPDAERAYDEMYRTTFDCIISDIMMPDIDGFEFAATVRSLNNDIPILFMTARDDFFFYFRLKRTADFESRLQIILIRPAASLRRDPIRSLRGKNIAVLA